MSTNQKMKLSKDNDYQSFTSIKVLLDGVKTNIQQFCRFLQMDCEVSQIKEYPYIVYLTLKDETGIIKGIVPKRYYNETLSEGDRIHLQGELTMYRHEVQISLRDYDIMGVGDEHSRFLEIRKKLEKKGYFDVEKKRPVRNRYRRIGIVTSLKAAGFKDMMETFHRRMVGGEIVVYPATVQGKTAPKQVADALQLANRHQYVELIIIARGGGSKEDLFCFNDPMIADEIVRSKIPVATGIGHQIDESIADLAADRSFITPTAAAQGTTIDRWLMKKRLGEMQNELTRRLVLLLRSRRDQLEKYQLQMTQKMKSLVMSYQQRLKSNQQHLFHDFIHQLKHRNQQLHQYYGRLLRFHPQSQIQVQRHALQIQGKQNQENLVQSIQKATQRREKAEQRLMTYQKIFNQGYILLKKDGEVLNSMKQCSELGKNDSITLQLPDGELQIVIKKVVA